MINENTKQQITADLKAYIAKVGSANKVATLFGVSPATLSNILAGKTEAVADTMWTKLEKQLGVEANAWKLAATTVSRRLEHFYTNSMRFSEVHGIVSPAGSGKTQHAKVFADRNPRNCWLISCNEYMNRKTFLEEVLRKMGKSSGGYLIKEMVQSIIETMHTTQTPLLILDEADKLNDQCLLFFITIFNLTEDKCGIILQGTEHLEKKIKRGEAANKRGYREIFSRIGGRFADLNADLKANKRADLEAICMANGVTDEAEVNRIVNDAQGDLRRLKRLVKAQIQKP